MGYSEGAHDAPADTKDRLVRVGSKYQATAPSVADGDNVYLLVDAAGRLLVTGAVAHDDVEAGNPVSTSGFATADVSAETDVAAGDRVRHLATLKGVPIFTQVVNVTAATDGASNTSLAVINDETDTERRLVNSTYLHGFAPDSAWDRLRTAGDSAPSLGALNVAVIGGDQALRASAAESGNGSSTALDNMGWVKSFVARLDVTAVPTGGTPTLDVYIQTQLPSGDWQDIAHFTQVAGSTTAEIVDWGRGDGNISGIGAEGVATTFDRFFADQDVAMTAANIRVMNLGDSLRVKWVKVVGGSTGNYTFAVDSTFHS